MTAQNRATTRDADQRTDRREQRPVHSHSPGEMALQSSRGFEATPQSFVRLTGSHLAKPRAIRADIIE
ncbi:MULTISPECIES: hypothetical protein [unclassified Bradyrhizobium]|jgi:hypothetical protein|uniref:hypothetical protein n=1 Tax=unclassified Bradyrhizobium TaxID=2631580 RepID=UPI0003A62E34|nr:MULTISPECIES: hypothetical protein [unclassified Bradyrhizobium]MCK1273349.1 hypothetical protein [Bradyrhizobium sp. 84]MCK1323378.1 hypothetical protein [Bradyrhizobium sp. 156]MCK1328702.1 hypothetical protein [Bradyrhizobium sp. CW9]MCK1350933.1 hypothetical protein [Bradyrhizobium sp. CW7]MCK1376307.1 hypothetical protein [Bradyrhizobium sp. 49]